MGKLAAELLEKQDTCSVAKASIIGAITDPADEEQLTVTPEENFPATEEEEEDEEIGFVSLLTRPLFRQTLERTHSSCGKRKQEVTF